MTRSKPLVQTSLTGDARYLAIGFLRGVIDEQPAHDGFVDIFVQLRCNKPVTMTDSARLELLGLLATFKGSDFVAAGKFSDEAYALALECFAHASIVAAPGLVVELIKQIPASRLPSDRVKREAWNPAEPGDQFKVSYIKKEAVVFETRLAASTWLHLPHQAFSTEFFSIG